MKKISIGLLSFFLSGFAMANLDSATTIEQVSKSYAIREKNGQLAGASVGIILPQNLKAPIQLNFGEIKSSDDNFEIGSISKSFTGILLSKLILEGKISLDSPIEEVIPELKGSFVGSVSAHLLATHSAQLANDISGSLFGEAELINYLKSYRPGSNFPKGERHYSNLGFSTLSLLIRRATGNNFINLVKEQIFKPLQMTGSGYLNSNDSFALIVQPHNVLLENTHYDLLLDLASASGGVFSNINDMTKFLQANISPESTPTLANAIKYSHTLGLGWDSDPGSTVIWKNGAMSGFGSIIRLNLEDHSGAIVLCNSRCTTTATSLAGIALGEADQYKLDLPISDEMKSSVVGTYQNAEKTYSTQVVLTGSGFLGLHIYEKSPDIYQSYRLRKNSETTFGVNDGLGSTNNDYVQFGIDSVTGKKQVHYFQMISKDSSGNPTYEDNLFTQL